QGGGYSLEAMVIAAMGIEGISLPDVNFDSEGDMFAARGSQESLKVIAELVRRLVGDWDYSEKAILHSVSKGHFD
ncbi:MAG TPA: hypothetical protein VEZ90_01125, partial [Blastocatellia bacterium]|nr:hypothetical protein [Blastocatellia bacterium]